MKRRRCSFIIWGKKWIYVGSCGAFIDWIHSVPNYKKLLYERKDEQKNQTEE